MSRSLSSTLAAAAVASGLTVSVCGVYYASFSSAEAQSSFTPAFVLGAVVAAALATASAAGTAAVGTRADPQRDVILVAVLLSSLVMHAALLGLTYYTTEAVNDGAVIGLPIFYVGVVSLSAVPVLALPKEPLTSCTVLVALMIPAVVMNFVLTSADLNFTGRAAAATGVGALAMGLAFALSLAVRSFTGRD